MYKLIFLLDLFKQRRTLLENAIYYIHTMDRPRR